MPNVTHKPQSDEVTSDHEDRAWKLRVRGWSQESIGRKLGVTQQAVSLMLKRASAKFSERFMQDVKATKDEQVAQLSFVAEEALRAWIRSKKAGKRNITKLKSGKESNLPYVDSKQVLEYECHGDVKYLTEFRKALEDIRKIMGADAPLQIKNIPNEIDLSRFTDEQLQAYIKLVEILNAPAPAATTS